MDFASFVRGAAAPAKPAQSNFASFLSGMARPPAPAPGSLAAVKNAVAPMIAKPPAPAPQSIASFLRPAAAPATPAPTAIPPALRQVAQGMVKPPAPPPPMPTAQQTQRVAAGMPMPRPGMQQTLQQAGLGRPQTVSQRFADFARQRQAQRAAGPGITAPVPMGMMPGVTPRQIDKTPFFQGAANGPAQPAPAPPATPSLPQRVSGLNTNQIRR